jgi:eukaryotic-like serine/threonine-protein kinase
VDGDYLRYLREQDHSPSRWSTLGTLQPPAVVFWYRQSPRHLSTYDYFAPGFAGGVVRFEDPPPALSGMVGVKLDPRGRLVYLQAVPPERDDAPGAEAEADWDALFAAAGLDAGRFRPVAPAWTPPTFADARSAWEGSYGDRADSPLRVEAASYRGRPVFFALVGPWTEPSRMQPSPPKRGERAVQAFFGAVLLCLLVGSVVVARRNLRLGRGDRRGAGRLALFVVAVTMLSWALGTDHVPTLSELGLFIIGLSWAVSFAVLIWLLYHAIEPYMRRRWPDALVSWSRVLAGSARDPVVGRDLLIGALSGATMILFYFAGSEWLYQWLGLAAPLPKQTNLRMLLGARYLFSEALSVVPFGILVALAVTFLLFLLRVFFRRDWLAAAVFIVALSIPSYSVSEHPWIAVPVSMALWAVTVLVLVRFGLLAVASQSLVQELLAGSPLTRDLSAWYAGASIAVLLLVIALAGFGFYASLGGRPLLREELLEA